MINTIHLFPRLDNLLFEILRSLSQADWNRPTVAGSWTVKDVAAHLLDVTMRDVSIYRDGYMGPAEPFEDLVTYLDNLNATWVNAYKRVSPRQIVEQIEVASFVQFEHLEQLEPDDTAIFSVAWAGESRSTNAFHIAREYTEKFHHQLQIRDAVGQKEPLFHKDLFHPFIHTLLMGLPFHYRDMEAEEGTTIAVTVADCGHWHLHRTNKKWELHEGENARPAAGIMLDKDIAWKLFTKAITPEEARRSAKTTGIEELASRVFSLLSVMTKPRTN